jgi:hypothetical protein
MRRTRAWTLAAVLGLAARGAVEAKHPLPGPHYLACEARGNAVLLSWDDLGVSPEFHEAVILRDGGRVAELEPLAVAYRDEGVPPGRHDYRLDILSRVSDPPGELIASRSCAVEVLLASGISCEVFGGIAVPPRVIITWEPPPPALEVDGIALFRDGEKIADLGPDSVIYEEEPLQGDHLYLVLGVRAGDDIALGDCVASYHPPKIGGFRRGDTNADGAWNVTDVIVMLAFLFRGGGVPPCLASADSNDDGAIDIGDGLHLAFFVFLSRAPPAMPFPLCGFDPTPDDLECEEFPPCFHPPPP